MKELRIFFMSLVIICLSLNLFAEDDGGIGWEKPDEPIPPVILSPYNFQVCFDYHCKNQQMVTITKSDWDKIISHIGQASSEEQERRQIAAAIAEWERIVGDLVGTSADLGGNSPGSGMPGQMDCIDETTNVTTYLLLMEQQQLFKFHQAGQFEHRGFFAGHWSASIISTVNGDIWAVDAWYKDNGQEPYIIPIERWRQRYMN